MTLSTWPVMCLAPGEARNKTVSALAQMSSREAGLDPVDGIAAAWRRDRPGTPVSSIGIVTRIWRLGKLLADAQRRLRDEGASDPGRTAELER